MPRRILAATAAVLLAVLGGVLVISYANEADARAREDEELATVYVVDGEIPAGTESGALPANVSEQQVPQRLVAPGAVTELSQLEGQVSTAALLPGDQLVTGRFADPTSLAPEGAVLAPEGMVEVSVALEPQRALGGAVRAGDTVSVHITDERPGEGGGTEYRPAMIFPSVLVTRVGASDDPAAPVTVTLAFSQTDAVLAVTGFENTNVWLALEKAALINPGTTDQITTVPLGDDS